jgi:hypothetical protein
MKRNVARALGGVVLAASGLACSACSGRVGEVAGARGGESSSVAALTAGATSARAYVGTTNVFLLGQTPVVASFDVLGGATIELEVVTRDASPVRFALWQMHVDGTATLEDPVDARSGFAIARVGPDENAHFGIVFPATPDRVDAIVRMDCAGGIHGCTPDRQPGESCPAGWSCDVGLVCQLPPGASDPLAAAGTCVVPPS